MHIFGLLTAKERIVTKNAQAAKNHCTLQISFDVSSNPASKTTTDVGIKMLETNKSLSATDTINALPGNIRVFFLFFRLCIYEENILNIYICICILFWWHKILMQKR